MNIKIIRNDLDYQSALKRLDVIFDAPMGSSEGNEAEIIELLIEKYEDEKFPMDEPDPIEAIKFRMEQMGMTKGDLAIVLDSRPRATEIMNRTRKLSLTMIRAIHEKMKVPLESLIADYT